MILASYRSGRHGGKGKERHNIHFVVVFSCRREREISEIVSGLIDVKVEEFERDRSLYTSVVRTKTALY